MSGIKEPSFCPPRDLAAAVLAEGHESCLAHFTVSRPWSDYLSTTIDCPLKRLCHVL